MGHSHASPEQRGGEIRLNEQRCQYWVLFSMLGEYRITTWITCISASGVFMMTCKLSKLQLHFKYEIMRDLINDSGYGGILHPGCHRCCNRYKPLFVATKSGYVCFFKNTNIKKI